MIQKVNQKDWQDVNNQFKEIQSSSKKCVFYIKINVFIQHQHVKMNLKTNENWRFQ